MYYCHYLFFGELRLLRAGSDDENGDVAVRARTVEVGDVVKLYAPVEAEPHHSRERTDCS